MVGIGNSQLTVNLTTRDVVDMRLTQTARAMNSSFVWNPTTKLIIKTEETDKQNDDNLTFLFEYRALLNSRLQTLITQLSNALAADLEVSMSASNTPFNDRPAMNGLSTNNNQDAGAARTAYNFMTGWFSTDAIGTGDPAALSPGAGTSVSPNQAFAGTFSGTRNANLAVAPFGFPAAAPTPYKDPTLNVQGSATIVQSESKLADVLHIVNLDGVTGTPDFQFENTAHTDNILQGSFSGPLGAAAVNAQAKSLFQKVLYDSLASVEYKPVLTSGLMKNLIISASSSLATGSQAQASFTLNYNGSRGGGAVDISLDKFTAFYHS